MSKKKEEKQTVKAELYEDRVLTENSSGAQQLASVSSYGALQNHGRVELTFLESCYLLEKERLSLIKGKRELDSETFRRHAQRKEKGFWIKYVVYRDLRERGYVVKTALKFGADFRVYDRGIKPGEDHARWVVYPVAEQSVLTWHEFSAKNRVAHSTKKRLLLGIVDGEGDVTYYEVKWIRP